MLHLLDETLEAFLRAEVPLPRHVDVAFDAPDGEWSAALSSRPTVDLYLWDVRRNTQRATTESRWSRRTAAGVPPPLPRVDCRYLVTAGPARYATSTRCSATCSRPAPAPSAAAEALQ